MARQRSIQPIWRIDMLSFLVAPLAAIAMVGATAPAPDTVAASVDRAQNMSLAPWAEPVGTTSYTCQLVSDDFFACIWDCDGTWVITDTSDCSVPPY